MNYQHKIIFILIFCCTLSKAIAQSIIVDDSKNAQELVTILTNNSSCLTSNASAVSGDSFSGSKNSYGSFLNTTSFPFSSGIILSTWSSKNSENGPTAANKAATGNPNWVGDTDLEQALGIVAPLNTKNATVLEFDFVPLTNFISFNYIFASNEYRDYFPCEFSDGFAFLIKEKSETAYKNIAVLPGSSIPVSSRTVHPVIPAANGQMGCPPSNESFFQGYNNGSSPLNYSGQTKILTAQSDVVAGATYHIKLVIADFRNEEYDSAVFIEAGSFAPKINLGVDQTICFGATTEINTGLTDPSYTYQWYKDDATNPIVGATQATYTATNPGKYSVSATIAGTGTTSCVAKGQVTIANTSKITKTATQCSDTNGNALFDLSQIASSLIDNPNTSVDYFETFTAYQQQNPKIASPSAYSSDSKTIYALVTNTAGTCTNYIEINLQVLPVNMTVQAYTFCENDGSPNGTIVFDLAKDIGSKVAPTLASPLVIEGYYLNTNDASSKQNKVNNSFTNTTNPQSIFIRIENETNCSSIQEISLNIQPYSTSATELINEVTVSDFSGNNSIDVTPSGTGLFEYSLDGVNYQEDSKFTNVLPGEYVVYIRDLNNCNLSSKRVDVLDYPRYFTPNGDGYNDTWNIKNLKNYSNTRLTIFNRYGKLLKELSANSSGWTGFFNGKTLPADDYWFQLRFEDGKVIKGHFSLKR